VTTYTLVQDLNSLRSSYNTRVLIQNRMCLEVPPLPSSIDLVPKTPHIRMTSRERVLNKTTETRASSSSKLVLQQSATNIKVMDT